MRPPDGAPPRPDRNRDPGAEAQFKAIAEAWSVLGNAEKRAAYDALGAGWQDHQRFEPPPGWAQKFHFAEGSAQPDRSASLGDVLASLFGTQTHWRATRGRDAEVVAAITLEEAWRGERVTVAVPPGTRTDAASRGADLRIQIPRGVVDGARVRIRGRGYLDPAGGPPGDLYAVFRIAPNTGANGRLRLRGRGLPTGHGAPGAAPRGDQLVALRVVLPDATSDTARTLYQRMATELAFDPRLPSAGASAD